jgi:hypothetical protein
MCCVSAISIYLNVILREKCLKTIKKKGRNNTNNKNLVSALLFFKPFYLYIMNLQFYMLIFVVIFIKKITIF